MIQLEFLLVCEFSVFVFNYSPKQGQSQTKINLKYIWSNLQKTTFLSVYRNKEYDIPNLSIFVEVSKAYKNLFVAKSVCARSLPTVIIDQYPATTECSTNDITFTETAVGLPDMFSFSEYRRENYGKWHLFNEILLLQSFEIGQSTEHMHVAHYDDNKGENVHNSYHPLLLETGFHTDDTVTF